MTKLQKIPSMSLEGKAPLITEISIFVNEGCTAE